MQKNAIIILTTYKPHVAEMSKELLCFLQENRIQADIYEYDGLPPAKPIRKRYDFAVSLGGDGTVLFAAVHRKKYRYFPLTSVNSALLRALNRHIGSKRSENTSQGMRNTTSG